MNLDEARELRAELNAIEATMQRIKDLWLSADFPSADDLDDLARTVGGISAQLEGIPAKVEQLPTDDDLSEMGNAVGRISAEMDSIIEKAGELPNPADLSS